VLLPLTLAWLAWMALGVRALWHARATTPARAAWQAAAWFAVALALRWAAPAVPHDINPRFDEVFRPWDQLQWRYTHGLVGLMRAVWALGAIVDDRVVFGVVAVAGALSVPWVAQVTRRLGGGALAGFVAATVLAGTGLHVRYSHTDAPQIVEAALTLLAVLVATRATAPGRADLVWLGLSLGLAACMRPEGMAVPVLLGFWALACGARWPTRQVALVAALVALVALPDLAGVAAAQGPSTRGAGLDQGHGALTWGLSHYAPFNAAFVPLALGSLTLLAPWGRPGQRRGWATLGLMLALGSLVANRDWSIGGTPVWCLARHQLRVLPWMAVLVGLGVEALVDRAVAWTRPEARGPTSALAAVAVAALTATTLPDAYSRFSLAEEYAFIRQHLPDVPDGCTVVTERETTDRGLMLRDGLTFLDQRVIWRGLGEDLGDASCVIYYRSGVCTQSRAGEPADLCAEFEQRHALQPLAEAEIVARAWLWERYTTPTLRVGYYRVTRPR
jgi:hypothetical protein